MAYIINRRMRVCKIDAEERSMLRETLCGSLTVKDNLAGVK